MDAFFTGLTKRQTMLLLTAVTFGGQEGVEVFANLPEDKAELLKDRASQILAIPREQRVPFLVQEIKRNVASRRADELRSADPALVAEALRNERPAMIEVILRALPASLADEVRIAVSQPVLELQREVRPELLAVIRWKLEEALARLAPARPTFNIGDLLVLPPKDVHYLADVLGIRYLATPLASVPAGERQVFLEMLPADLRQRAARLFANPSLRRLRPEEARQIIGAASPKGDPREACRLAGIRRIARACLSESPELASRLIERHHSDFGRNLARIVSEERQLERKGNERVRAEVLAELERLANSGVIERPVRLSPPRRRSQALRAFSSGGMPVRRSSSAVARRASGVRLPGNPGIGGRGQGSR